MNINDKITNALKPLSIPVYPDVADVKGDEYIVYNYADEYFGDYSDGRPETDTAVIQVHYFCRKKNPHTVRTSLAERLRQAGFDVGIGSIVYEDDTAYRHCTITATYTAETNL